MHQGCRMQKHSRFGVALAFKRCQAPEPPAWQVDQRLAAGPGSCVDTFPQNQPSLLCIIDLIVTARDPKQCVVRILRGEVERT